LTEATSEPNHDAAGDEPAASHDSVEPHEPAALEEPGGSGADPRQERVLSTEVLRRGRYLEFRVVTIERSDGRTSTRDIVGHPGAVAIVALDPDDRLLLVRQFRLAAGRSLLELPAGTLDIDAATGEVEQPDLAAARELEEETGYRAGSLERIGEFWTAPGFATELMTLYLATDLRPADEADRLAADEDELLDLERLSVEEALDAVDRGEICDAKSIVGVLQLARRRAAVP
jgi:ADP-ribose pyrophosphatase